ncbi:MAG: hypothetical protein ABI684_15620 [Nitrospirota bacterium]
MRPRVRASIIRHWLQRRATAPKRVGVPYQIRDLCDPEAVGVGEALMSLTRIVPAVLIV